MKTIRKLKWYFLFLILIGLDGSGVFAQNENGPISNYTEIVYLNLDAGNVTITSSTYEGYRWSGNTPVKISGTASSSALYYIYQARPNTSWGPGNPPRYPAVTTTSGATGSGALNIVNNTDVMAVINGWNAKVASNNAAQSNENYKRYSTSNWIKISCHARINICLDNIWSTHQGNNSGTTEGGLSFVPSDPNPERYCRLNVYLKGDSRMGNVYYSSHAIPDNGSEEYLDYTNSHIIFRSADGNGAVTGTLTVADIDPINQTHNFTLPNTDPNATSYTIRVTANHYNSVIGGSDDTNLQDSRGIDIKGGTIFAGALFEDNCTAIGAGGNGVGVVTIDGGQVTAVTSSTGTAIGGGIGWIDFGGEGHVTINGGKVYAYNHGVAYVYDDHLRYVPATAIGGGSSFRYPCNPCTVTITGGEVYAQSVGGVAIGGGGSGLQNAGHGTVNISNGIVTAKSINGTVTSSQMPAGMQTISVPAGAALGGGTGGLGTAYGGAIAYGGNATVNISGGQLFAGSVGGGAANDPNGKIGSATVRVTGGTSQAQFIMAGGSTGNCSFYMDNGIVQNSKTSSTEFILLRPDGGALWMDDTNGTATIKGGTIRGCEATNGGAIYMTGGSFTMSGGTVGGSSLTNGNKAANNGGALYMGGGTFEMTGGSIQYNKATASDGGGVYIASGGTVEITGGEIKYNQAQQNGGGFAVEGGTVDISQANTTHPTLITNNQASNNGGGFWVDVADATSVTTIKGGATIANNTAVNGAGAYVNQGQLVIQDAATNLTSNTASTSGGGIYMANGTVSVTNAMVQTNTATSGNGGGLYVGSGDITVSGAKVSGNSAANGKGGGIYAGNGNILVKDNAKIGTYTAKAGSGNTAKEGGGLYVNGGSVVFTGGTFAENYASEKGGGIYIKEGATLNLRETATITRNHVPATGQGGGVYMNGTLNVGENATDPATKHAIIVRDNYAGSAYSLATRNNVFLPSTTKYITLLSDIHASASKVGFSVTQGFCPVIYTDIEGGNASHEQWLYDLLGGTSGLTGAIFDDAQKYFALHVRTDQGPFEAKYDYLWGAWTTHVYHNPNEHLDEYPLPTGVSTHFTEESDGWHIYTKEGLAWFISYVNGLNNAGEHRNANAFLENDVDMSGHLWVPIGGTVSFDSEQGIFADGGYYNGHFDGKGHVISNLDCRYMNAVLKIGLFGKVTGGSVTNTFVDGYQFLTQFSDKAYYLGGIAGWATGGTISNCEARGLMETEFCEGSESYMGGLVGKLEGATVHSSMAMPTMTGIAQHMGGLAGYVASSNTLKNSFSNAEITRGSNNSQIGGLAGTNSGTIENCYVRLRGTEPANFGWFAGSNGGSIQYCYALNGHTNYVNTGTAPVGSGNYAPTALEGGKYGYAHQDQEVTATNTYVENGAIDNQGELKGLLATLNNWVEAQPATAGYSTWTRTMASPINDDLPILEFDDFVSAGSTDNVFIAYRDDLNDMIGYANANSTGGSVYLYDATPTAVGTSTNANVRVYIAPNVGITQAANNTLNARVGVTLDNSSTDFMAYDWHMFSSALQSAPMGLVYHGDEGTYYVRDNYTTLAAQGITHADYTDVTKMDPPMTTWNTTPGQIGYFPTDAPYGPWRNTGSLSQGFDFYCFHEPSRHWINFKREGKAGFYDHWHQNADENGMHQNIGYTNEADMEVGKGYMLAITAPSMLMTDGVLNNGDKSRNASFTAGGTYDHPLRGINLVGNPYQSYLDFNAFANENGFDTYYILDADKRGYIAYTAGATPQVDAPSRYIHPHQGFFVRVTETQDIEFNNEMRVAGPNSSFESDYRDWEPRYALVNMVCTDGEGRNDFATIELDRPEQGGGRKAKGLRSGDASIWFRLGDEDYQIAFAPVGTTSAPLRFEAHADGAYTLRWNMQNADFDYLHLVDNLTGTDIDCLQANEYRFEATTHDYTSRFRLVFEFTGVEENDEPTEGPSSFAFMMGDELVINGEGMLQMFDLNGRQLFSTEIHGTQATVAMPKVADGLYVLRLTNGNQVRTQKMVINK